jgi:hypothetical protein
MLLWPCANRDKTHGEQATQCINLIPDKILKLLMNAENLSVYIHPVFVVWWCSSSQT